MNLKNLSDDLLFSGTIAASKKEKTATIELLEYLAEMYVRRLAAARGFSDLFDFLRKELKYSEPQASERMSAVRLMVKLPEAKDKLEQDSISLTSMVKLASFVRREKCSVEKASELLSAISDKSTREAERVLASEQTVPVLKPDRIKPSGPETTRISFDADLEFLELLEEMKNFDNQGSRSLNERLKEAMRVLIEKKKSKHVPKRKSAPVTNTENTRSKDEVHANPSSSADASARKVRAHEVIRTGEAESATPSREESTSHSLGKILNSREKAPEKRSPSRYWPIAARAFAIKRANGCCEFVDPTSGRRCESRKALEFDHFVPFAKGGASTADNIRLLCANHNRFEAVREFGEDKMRAYGGT